MSIPLRPTNLPDVSSPPAAVVAVAADLVFASRIRAAADAAGLPVHVSRSEDDAAAAARSRAVRLVLIDLDTRSLDPIRLIERLRAPESGVEAPVIAFVSHVRTDTIRAARAAGADRVLARSAFVRELPELLRTGSG